MKFIFSLQKLIMAGSYNLELIYYSIYMSFLSAAISIASLYLPILCNNKYCSSFFLEGILAIIFIAHVVSPLSISRSATSSTGSLKSFCRFYTKIKRSSYFLLYIKVFILANITLLSGISYSFLKSSTALPSLFDKNNYSCFPRVVGFTFSFTYFIFELCLMN